MTTTEGRYRIAEVAARTGFSTPTLRYYEEIGLLPPAPRTGAGYRQYDERAIERLAFIARAKRLGCSLEEIADLTTAWDRDECAPVQHRLRAVVAAKREEIDARMAELALLASELQTAATALDGPCSDTCGCMAARPPGAGAPPIACSLGADEIPARLAEWSAVLGSATSRVAIDGGVRITFDDGVPMPVLAQLVAAEQGCCRFFSFAITVDGRGIALDVTAPPEAAELVDSVFGSPD